MGDAAREPYPPDPGPDDEAPTALDDALDGRFESVDFSNVRALRSSLRRVELRLCRLTGAELGEATWTDVSLSDCRLDLASFRHAQLQRVVFRDCNLDEVDFAGARLKDVRFERCLLRLARFVGASAERLELERCDLEGFDGVDVLRGARMRWEDVVENAHVFARALGVTISGD